MRYLVSTICLVMATAGVAACDKGAPDKAATANAAPVTTALVAPEPKASAAQAFLVDTDKSQATFLMDAPLEKIYGEVAKGVSGELSLDMADLTKSTALIEVDLLKLTISQEKREDEKSEFKAKTMNPVQNDHMRTWFEISDDAPADVREKNRVAQFKVTQVEPSVKDLTAVTGDARTFTAKISGDLRVHQRSAPASTEVEVTVHFQGGQPKGLEVKTLKPLMVGLEKHDIRPRSAFQKLAEKTLAALGGAVAPEAPVMLTLSAARK